MNNWLAKDFGLKVVAVAIAVFLWVIFTSDPEVGAFVSVPIEFRSMPQELEIVGQPVDSVTLDLRGPADRVREFSANPRPVVLDFGEIEKAGERTFQIEGANTDLPTGLKLNRAIPAQVRYEFERRATRLVPVQVRSVGTSAFGPLEISVSPEKLTIVGPETHVERVEFAVTDPIDLATLQVPSSMSVNTFLDDSLVRFQDPSKVTVKVTHKKVEEEAGELPATKGAAKQ